MAAINECVFVEHSAMLALKDLPEELLELIAALMPLRSVAALRAVAPWTRELSLRAWACARPGVVLPALSDPCVPAGIAAALARDAVDARAIVTGPPPSLIMRDHYQRAEEARAAEQQSKILAYAETEHAGRNIENGWEYRSPPIYSRISGLLMYPHGRRFKRELFAGAEADAEAAGAAAVATTASAAAPATASAAAAWVDFENPAVVEFIRHARCVWQFDDNLDEYSFYADALCVAMVTANLPLLEHLAAASPSAVELIRLLLAYAGAFEPAALARVLALANLPEPRALVAALASDRFGPLSFGSGRFADASVAAAVLASVLYFDNAATVAEIFGPPDTVETLLATIPRFWQHLTNFVAWWPRPQNPSRTTAQLLLQPSARAAFRASTAWFHAWAEASPELFATLFVDSDDFWSRISHVELGDLAWYLRAAERWPKMRINELDRAFELYGRRPLVATTLCRALKIDFLDMLLTNTGTARLAMLPRATVATLVAEARDPAALRSFVQSTKWGCWWLSVGFIALLKELELTVDDLHVSLSQPRHKIAGRGELLQYVTASCALGLRREHFFGERFSSDNGPCSSKVFTELIAAAFSPSEPFGLVWLLRKVRVRLADLGLDYSAGSQAAGAAEAAQRARVCARYIRRALVARVPAVDAGLEELFAAAGAGAGTPFLVAATAASPAVFARVLAKTPPGPVSASALATALTAGHLDVARALGAAHAAAVSSRQYCRLFRRLVGRQNAAALRVLVEIWQPPPAPVLDIAYAIAHKIAHGATRQLVVDLHRARERHPRSFRERLIVL